MLTAEALVKREQWRELPTIGSANRIEILTTHFAHDSDGWFGPEDQRSAVQFQPDVRKQPRPMPVAV